MSSKSHDANTITGIRGVIRAVHCPKLMFRFRPAGSFRYFRAMAFGGVPIGVPIPPMLAPIGMASASAVFPFSSSGSEFSTGAIIVIIMAAVAVLLTNIDISAVVSIKPSSSSLGLRLNGFSRMFATSLSSPDSEAASAITNPPKNRIIIGSAYEPSRLW